MTQIVMCICIIILEFYQHHTYDHIEALPDGETITIEHVDLIINSSCKLKQKPNISEVGFMLTILMIAGHVGHFSFFLYMKKRKF